MIDNSTHQPVEVVAGWWLLALALLLIPLDLMKSLIEAVANNDAELVEKILFEDSGQLNLQDPHSGDTPMHVACRHGYTDCLRILIEYDADAGRRNYSILTPIGEARMNGRTEVIQILKNNYDFRSASALPAEQGWDAWLTTTAGICEDSSHFPVVSVDDFLRLREEKCRVEAVRRVHPGAIPSRALVQEQRRKLEKHQAELRTRHSSATTIQSVWRRRKIGFY